MKDCYTSTFTGRSVAKGWSDFHFYEFVHHESHGLCLFLDGVLQSAERDQSVYHEKLVRAALEEQRSPNDVLIVGGTGGGVLHHLYRFVDPKKCMVTVVDIDEKLFVTGRRIMRPWNQHEFDLPSVNILFENGTDYLKKVKSSFDVIIIDVGDPIPETSSSDLYSVEVLADLSRSLRSDGIVAFHSPLELTSDHVFVSETIQGNTTLQKISHFPVHIPSFERTWMFNTLKKHTL